MELNEQSLNLKMEELKTLYKSYVSNPSNTKETTVNYINSAFNCINVISKIISLSIKLNIPNKKTITKKDIENLITKRITSNATQTQQEEDEIEEIMYDELYESVDGQEDDDSDDNDDNIINRLEDLPKMAEEKFATDKQAIEYLNKAKYIHDIFKDIAKNVNNADKSENKLSDEEKQQLVDEFDSLLDKYEDSTEEEIIHDELISWGAKPTWAGFKYLMNLRKAIELSDGTLNKDSEPEELYKYVAEANNVSVKQVKTNIKSLVRKCDFSNPLFCVVLRDIIKAGMKFSDELVIRELLDFYSNE